MSTSPDIPVRAGRTLRYGSLFSGIGGLDLGLDRAGMTCAWQVEWSEWCRKVLTKHWPDVPKYGDITTLTGEELEPVDLICGGFPCQPVSYAGLRAAQDDERWLWPEFARLIRVLRPRYVLMENVPGLLTAGFGDVLTDLAALGYDTEWDCIPAAAFGAPHLRYRVVVVADANGDRLEEIPDNGVLRHETDHPRHPRYFGSGRGKIERSDWWESEPELGRMVDGIPDRVDRLRGIGNAVVPQLAEWVGRRILEAS